MLEYDQIEELVEASPPGIDPFEWDTLPTGRRLRVLREAHYLMSLPPGTREKIRQLPRWIGFGPEHGFPPEWFNASELLLPKFREGGGRHVEFQAAQRQIRLVQTAVQGSIDRLDEWSRRNQSWLGVLSGLLGVALYLTLAAVLVPLIPRNPLVSLFTIAFLAPAYQFGQRVVGPLLLRLVLECRVRGVRRAIVARGTGQGVSDGPP